MQDEDRENDVRTMAAGENGDGDKAFEFEHSQQDDLSSGEAVEGKKKRPADKMSQAGLYQVRK